MQLFKDFWGMLMSLDKMALFFCSTLPARPETTTKSFVSQKIGNLSKLHYTASSVFPLYKLARLQFCN